MVPFVGPSYQLSTRKASVQRTVNMFLVGMETPGKAPFILQSFPGLSLFVALGAVVRWAYAAGDRAFVVAGSTLYELASDGTATSRGTLATASGAVDMAHGNSQLVIVDGANGYVLTLATNVFAQITDPDFYGSTRVWFLDNYFLFIRPDTGQFYISAIDDASSFDALDFATAESQPDNLVSMAVVGDRLLLAGGWTLETFRNGGSADFPLERSQGSTLDVGCLAPHSVRVVDGTMYWIGRDKNGSGMVLMLDGARQRRVSTQAVEQALRESSDLSQAVCFAYQKDGLTFYWAQAPGLPSAWVYEVAAGAWYEACDLDGVGQFMAHRANCHVYAFGKHLVGDADGNVYELDADINTNNGDALVRERVSPHSATASRQFVFFDKFWLDCTTGEAPQGEDPMVELSTSNDSGATWTNPRLQSLGRVGERFPTLEWNRMGRDKDRVTKVRFSGNAPFAIVDGGYANPTTGTT